MTKENVDVCIIGGGAEGLFCAFELSKAGLDVRLIDRSYFGVPRHTIGDIVLQRNDPDMAKLIKTSHSLLKDSQTEYDLDFGFKQRGSVYFAVTSKGAENLLLDVARDEVNGVDSTFLDNRDEIEQALNCRLGQNVVAAKISAGDGAIDVGLTLDSLRKALIKNGVKVWGDDSVSEILTEGEKAVGVRTEKGDECYAKHIIVAAGSWSSKLLTPIGERIPLRPARAHLFDIFPHGDMPQQIVNFRQPFGDILIKYQQRNGRVYVVYNGIKDQAQATWNGQADVEAEQWVLEHISNLLQPLMNPEIRSISTYIQAVTPDFKPIVGAAQSVGNLYIATGMANKNFACAPAVGRAVKSLIIDEKVQDYVSGLNVDRFNG